MQQWKSAPDAELQNQMFAFPVISETNRNCPPVWSHPLQLVIPDDVAMNMFLIRMTNSRKDVCYG